MVGCIIRYNWKKRYQMIPWNNSIKINNYSILQQHIWKNHQREVFHNNNNNNSNNSNNSNCKYNNYEQVIQVINAKGHNIMMKILKVVFVRFIRNVYQVSPFKNYTALIETIMMNMNIRRYKKDVCNIS